MDAKDTPVEEERKEKTGGEPLFFFVFFPSYKSAKFN